MNDWRDLHHYFSLPHVYSQVQQRSCWLINPPSFFQLDQLKTLIHYLDLQYTLHGVFHGEFPWFLSQYEAPKNPLRMTNLEVKMT